MVLVFCFVFGGFFISLSGLLRSLFFFHNVALKSPYSQGCQLRHFSCGFNWPDSLLSDSFQLWFYYFLTPWPGRTVITPHWKRTTEQRTTFNASVLGSHCHPWEALMPVTLAWAPGPTTDKMLGSAASFTGIRITWRSLKNADYWAPSPIFRIRVSRMYTESNLYFNKLSNEICFALLFHPTALTPPWIVRVHTKKLRTKSNRKKFKKKKIENALF